ncbi:MAG TPA: RluA family pseudouridine synthase [Candidatus Woesebacteria bacterium]|nr:RluA family pseudouridine synthase [Candidatus Woesebacteria bacterium]HPR99601.1 RluA family pseudouridine synthase [Candidatus Woesebacteria bacterium]
MEEKAKIIYQDKDILIINKKSGVVSTKEGRKDKETLEDWLIQKFGKNDLPRQGVVHRLDKGTSGLMVVVKNTETRNEILEMFKKREIKKTYLALVEGDLPKDGEINVPINRSKYVFGKFTVSEDGKVAETSFKLLKKYYRDNKVYSLIEIDLKTGRTHQIRVHFSYLKWPLVGDLTYGGTKLLGLSRPFLESIKLEFKHPKTGANLSFEGELASDLKELLAKL